MTSRDMERLNRNTIISRMLAEGHLPIVIAKFTHVSERFIREFHRTGRRNKSVITAKRMEGKFVSGSADECWKWTGATSRGYGIIARQGAHRAMFQLRVGDIPKGHDIHHKCGNKGCVNPNHLIPLTHKEHAMLHGAKEAVQ